MRGYVTVHPDYVDMPAWAGRETADITYDDAAGGLTAILIDRGYLQQEEWLDARPRYLIEVKSTTGPCATPFFMSKHQYQRVSVSSTRNHAVGPWSTVYVNEERLLTVLGACR